MSQKTILDSGILRKYWHIPALLALFVIALWIRTQTLDNLANCIEGMVCLQALDPFYFYRMAEYLLAHDFHLPFVDTMRYVPFGAFPHADPSTATMYTPAILYALVSLVFKSMTFLEWAQFYPALMGALFVIPMYFIGKELFNKQVGLFAALFTATSASLLYRTSAGFIEKEPLAGLFLLIGVYYFIRALKKNTVLDGAIAGLALTVVNITWGGMNFMALMLASYTGMLLFFNKQPGSLARAYTSMTLVILGFPLLTGLNTFVSLSRATGQLMLAALVVLAARWAVEKYRLVDKEKLKYFVPGLSAGMAFLGFIGTFFSKTLSQLFVYITGIISFSQGVIGTTVQENAPADWADITSQLGTSYSAVSLPQLSWAAPYVALWAFMLLGGLVMVLRTAKHYGDRKWMVYTGVFLSAVIALINDKAGIFLFIILLSLLTKKWDKLFAGWWVATALFATFSKVRIIFLLGPAAAIMGAYFLWRLIEFCKTREFSKNNIFKTAGAVFIGLIVIVNVSSAYGFMSGIGPSFSPNWQDAMQFVKTNTSEDAVLMSWWDYGYWFQTGGRRASVADGGNQNGTLNEILAQMFTSENRSKLVDVINTYSVDYVVVDYTLIGKYSAMSKIASYGEKVDVFMNLGRPRQVTSNNKTVMVYQLGTDAFYVPVDPETGGLAGPIKFVSARGEAHVKYLCTENGLADLEPPDPVMDQCILFSRYGVYLPYPTKEAGISNFAQLYIWEGKGIDFLEKVFDNEEIKIYEVKHEVLA